MPLTEDDTCALGDYAERLLTDHLFNVFLNLYDQSTIGTMLATKPGQVEEREKSFASIYALREFIAFMQEFVVQRDRLREPPVEDGDDPAVHDIYRTD